MSRKRTDAVVVMPEISSEEQDRLLKLLQRHHKSLRARAGVKHVGIGYAFKEGTPTNELALVAVVDRKVQLDQLRVKDRLPEEIGGIRVDVIERLLTPATGPRDRFDPLMGGIQIETPEGAATLGCIVFDDVGAMPFALTCEHVVTKLGIRPTTTVTVGQPTRPPASIIGTYVNSDTKTDSALVSVDGHGGSAGARGLSTAIFTGPAGHSKGSGTPLLGMRVRKAGVRTGLTSGIISLIIMATSTTARWFEAVQEHLIGNRAQQFANQGDSGSVVYQHGTGMVVGLLDRMTAHVDRSGIGGGAHFISDVLEALKCFIYDDDAGLWARSPVWIGGHGCVFVITKPFATATLTVRYPSGRYSTAKGLGSKQADRNGFIKWSWVVGTSTGRRPNVNSEAIVTTDGGVTRHSASFSLDGVPRTDR